MIPIIIIRIAGTTGIIRAVRTARVIIIIGIDYIGTIIIIRTARAARVVIIIWTTGAIMRTTWNIETVSEIKVHRKWFKWMFKYILKLFKLLFFQFITL